MGFWSGVAIGAIGMFALLIGGVILAGLIGWLEDSASEEHARGAYWPPGAASEPDEYSPLSREEYRGKFRTPTPH